MSERNEPRKTMKISNQFAWMIKAIWWLNKKISKTIVTVYKFYTLTTPMRALLLLLANCHPNNPGTNAISMQVDSPFFIFLGNGNHSREYYY